MRRSDRSSPALRCPKGVTAICQRIRRLRCAICVAQGCPGYASIPPDEAALKKESHIVQIEAYKLSRNFTVKFYGMRLTIGKRVNVNGYQLVGWIGIFLRRIR
jgi:hypothetical protein